MPFISSLISNGMGIVYESRAMLDVEGGNVEEEGRRPLLKASDSDDDANEEMVTIDLKDVADYELNPLDMSDSCPLDMVVVGEDEKKQTYGYLPLMQ